MTRAARASIAETGTARPSSEVLEEIERSIESAWEAERREHPDEAEASTARRVTADASRHPWRLVDAALLRLFCDACGASLGSGPVGCPSCDLAHGFRFGAREPDRPGVPAGNEHAIRVSTAVLRAPHRYPAWAVEANLVHLPLFVAGDMPSRGEQELMLEAARRGVHVDAAGARTFRELAARAEAAVAAVSGPATATARRRRRPRDR